MKLSEYITKDSGARQDFDSGMRRDILKGKPRFDLIWQPGIKRIAELYGRGAEKYGDRNWELANTVEEMERFKGCAYRHFYQWFNNENPEEDHMAAICFNIFAAEMVKKKLGENSGSK